MRGGPCAYVGFAIHSQFRIVLMTYYTYGDIMCIISLITCTSRGKV